MDALTLLETQHKEVDALIEEIEKGRSMELKAERFASLADKLAAHATIEEKLFYPAVMAKQTEDLLLESVEEHLQIKRILADLLELDVADDKFDAKLSVLKEELEHHAHEEEEDQLFPQLRKLFDDDELEDLGTRMEMEFDQIMQTEPRRRVSGETTDAAPLPSP